MKLEHQKNLPNKVVKCYNEPSSNWALKTLLTVNYFDEKCPTRVVNAKQMFHKIVITIEWKTIKTNRCITFTCKNKWI